MQLFKGIERAIARIRQKGTLKRDISAGELREILTKSFIKENEKDNSKIKKMFRGNKNEPKQ